MKESKNEPAVEAAEGADGKVLSNVISIDQGRIQDHLNTMVLSTVEETLNAFLDMEADRLCRAKRYERSPDRADKRAGHYERDLHTKAGEVTLKVPKLRKLPLTKTAELGHRVYFTTAIDMARKLALALAENRLHREMKNLTRPKLLIIDEVGYLALDKIQASMLFQVICNRYENHQAIILSSNKAFTDWGHVFANDPVMASAALDRLLHRATVINIRGESYRLKEKKKTGRNLNPPTQIMILSQGVGQF